MASTFLWLGMKDVEPSTASVAQYSSPLTIEKDAIVKTLLISVSYV